MKPKPARIFSASKQIAVLSMVVQVTASSFAATPSTNTVDYYNLQMPQLGDHTLHVLSPTNLELVLIDTAQLPPYPVQTSGTYVEPAESWNFIDTSGNFTSPPPSHFTVTVNGQSQNVVTTGFKRRPFYAPNHNR
ncbi:MAG TPA: hypothetical protein VE843_17705, partial [Ktedonobacteraceae bacterium]|nr:hypothetical protein [Ktedonobacteraceae bacterium]